MPSSAIVSITEMKSRKQELTPRTIFRWAILIYLSLAVSLSCAPSKNATVAAPAKRYPLTGRVVSIDKTNKSINVDGKEIPGFMPAMTMPYSVKDESLLNKLAAGDQIKAEIVVSEGGAYLDNVTATGKATPRSLSK
jgi:protein SCO1/2